MKDILEQVKSIIEPFKRPLIIVAIVAIAFMILKVVVPIVGSMNSNKTPVKEIQAKCDKVYKRGETIELKDISVRALHEDGKFTNLNTEQFALDRNTLEYCGDTTKVVVIYLENESITCEIEVKCEREKVTEFACGTPNIDDVHAVLYSNGEMCFEGKGDIAKYDEYNYPWKKYMTEDEETYQANPILSISFEDTITPKNMDALFYQMSTIEYVSELPATVESLEYTFAECPLLKYAARWSNCENITSIRHVYDGCTSLIDAPEIPESVLYADFAYSNCDSLETTPIMENCINLGYAEGMYAGSEKLAMITKLPPYLININAMFKECVNIKAMPEIPETVSSMQETFSGCISMKTPTILPRQVDNVQNCFYNCKALEGLLWIDCDPHTYDSCFSEAATLSTLDLQGNSRMLDVLANTTENNAGITVNGKTPNPNIKVREDVIKEQMEE